MYTAFKMKMPQFKEEEFDNFYREGNKLFSMQKKTIYSALEAYLSPEGCLQASEIEKEWFPSITADVFLSHSHKDEKQVIAFAGYLKKMNITSFIDSGVWGYADELLKQIDDSYNVNQVDEDGSKTYSYKGRNYSTSHVHMILNSALAKMIDSTECVIFLDTPNSLKVSKLNKAVTGSPWIYSELVMTKILEQIEPKRLHKSHQDSKPILEFSQALEVDYNVDISHLVNLTIGDIQKAAGQCGKNDGTSVLDCLYFNKGLYGGK